MRTNHFHCKTQGAAGLGVEPRTNRDLLNIDWLVGAHTRGNYSKTTTWLDVGALVASQSAPLLRLIRAVIIDTTAVRRQPSPRPGRKTFELATTRIHTGLKYVQIIFW